MPTVYVIRHADAGNRSAWRGDDNLRPLSRKGRRQAEAIARELAGAGATRLVSSPSARCIETLEPLAVVTGLTIETDARLREGSDGAAALALSDELRELGDVAVLCSHGDVIPDLLSELRGLGITFHHEPTWPKGSTWVLSGDGTGWTDAHHIPAKS
ncbi:MAG TPA: phosphoglycerate mutase family protein [Acidimicrobiales bacterium]